MKKIKTLSQEYKRYKRILHGVPFFAGFLIVFGIIWMLKIPEAWWVGLILIGMSVFFIFLYIIVLLYYNYKIETLEKEEALTEEKLKKLNELVKEQAGKDEKIKELEEALKNAKNEE